MQKYSYIIESFACILKTFVIIFSFVFLLFFDIFGKCLTAKLSIYSKLLPFTYKAIQGIPIDWNSSKFITYAPCFTLGKLFIE